MSDVLRKTSRYLDDHWVLKWFVAPILFMASMLFVVGLFVTKTAGETVQVVGLFVAISLAVVALGLALDWAVHNVTGWNLLASDSDRGRR